MLREKTDKNEVKKENTLLGIEGANKKGAEMVGKG